MKDLTRSLDFMQKRGVCYANYVIDTSFDLFDDLTFSYQVGNLPPEAVIQNAHVFTQEASDAGAVIVGTTDGGSEILAAGDSGVIGESGAFTGPIDTNTGVPVFLGFAANPTQGKFVVTVEYQEYRKHTGELTLVNN